MILELFWSALDRTWIFTFIVGFITLYMVRHLLVIRSLPPGPFPLPVVGNVKLLIHGVQYLTEFLADCKKKYGDVFTIWLGPQHTIVFCGWENCKEALVSKRSDLSGRIVRHSGELYLCGSMDVMLADYGPCWETLRKILTLAARKYSVSEELAVLVADIVDEVGEKMVKEGRPVEVNDYTYLALYNILASSTFGKRYELEDPEFLSLRASNDKLNELIENGLPSDALPILRFVFWKKEKILRDECLRFFGFFEKYYKEHKETYQKGVVRDFTDAVIAARDEAEEESKDSLQYLTDKNLVALTLDLFGAGTETTRITINWILLFACQYPDIQKKMQREIDENIGSCAPVQSDRDSCPYIYACITEMLRIRPVIDLTPEHKAICDTEVAGHKVPKGSSVMFSIASCHNDEEAWPEPEVFKPERFLDDKGRFTNTRTPGYMPFGLGRRACPGEKLGLADVFLIVVRLLQKFSLELENGAGSADINIKRIGIANYTHPYKVVVKRR